MPLVGALRYRRRSQRALVRFQASVAAPAVNTMPNFYQGLLVFALILSPGERRFLFREGPELGHAVLARADASHCRFADLEGIRHDRGLLKLVSRQQPCGG